MFWAPVVLRWILMPDESSPDVDPNPFNVEFASNGVIWCAKNMLLPLFERRDVALRKQDT